MKEWHFNILFFVGVGGALVLLFGPNFGLDIANNPSAVTGVAAILTYVLTQKKTITKDRKSTRDPEQQEETDERNG